jgi:predicted dithiol-disulfide oxidoreductase (DUF899 family)
MVPQTTSTKLEHQVVSQSEWDERRAELLKKEKQLSKDREALTAEIRALPWVKIEKKYVFQTTTGEKTLAELFDDKSQLFVYHFMFGPEAKEGCPSCSFWADNMGAFRHHLPPRDVSFKVISRGPLDKIQAFRKRMGWEFDWVSSAGSDFNFDFGCTGGQWGENNEGPGMSIFYRDGDDVYRTYFTTNRGIEIANPTYAVLDMVPKGRDESDQPYVMAWVKHHDKY